MEDSLQDKGSKVVNSLNVLAGNKSALCKLRNHIRAVKFLNNLQMFDERAFTPSPTDANEGRSTLSSHIMLYRSHKPLSVVEAHTMLHNNNSYIPEGYSTFHM